MSELPDGGLLYRLKRRWRNGTTEVVFDRSDFIAKLAALVPAPRAHLRTYHGILAPAAKWRPRIVLPHLIEDRISAHARLSAVLQGTGRFHIRGVGLNTVSKVLACHDRRKWPVYNSRVETALRDYGYHLPRLGSAAAKYLAFQTAMAEFMKDAKIPDVVALDCFFNFVFKRRKES